MEEQLCLTPEQASRMLGIGRTFVYQLLASGQLQSIKLGRRRLIPRDALERFVAREQTSQAN